MTNAQFKVKRNLTLPTLSLKANEVCFVRFDEKIYIGKKAEPKDKEAAKEPPHLVNVTDLETGEQKTLILNTVLVSTINEAYPNDSYVGLAFRIEKLEKKAGKDYHTFKVQEVEAPQGVAAAAPQAAP